MKLLFLESSEQTSQGGIETNVWLKKKNISIISLCFHVLFVKNVPDSVFIFSFMIISANISVFKGLKTCLKGCKTKKEEAEKQVLMHE